MREGAPKTIYRKDYQVPDYTITEVDLAFDIRPGSTIVRSELAINRTGDHERDLVLDGVDLGIQSIAIDGRVLEESEYSYAAGKLSIPNVGDQFTFAATVEISPETNTSLEGLYRSRTIYCTQCEAEGFRKITFFTDRPDVLSTYRVSVEADRGECPILLSNGNLVEEVDLDNGRHRAVWQDPHPKPSYLFALVAGDLSLVESDFVTKSGKSVELKIWVEAKDVGYCDHAMESLKASMRWDEDVYGLEYDLELFNIVAVDDFNMGAMENKSLNVFNTSCVLAHPDITTDAGYQRVEGVVAHEYFHNYSGNRVTCRDWFQLSLKEGFTVFRDAEFTADMNSRGVKRIEDVAFLRTHQFAEDSGPMAHPVRPDSFIEISNFYTMTVYEKGAEVVRMLHTLLGAESFYKGSTLYFDRFDGMAVTCDDFVDAMEEASGKDLSQFRRWYEQAGTPEITVDEVYDEQTRSLRLTVSQHNPPTPGQDSKPPLHIPIEVAILVDGQHLELGASDHSTVLELTEQQQHFEFDNVSDKPVVSLLRGFSAPVRVNMERSEADLTTLIAHDDDPFVRWDAAQTLACAAIDAGGHAASDAYIGSLRTALSGSLESAMKAQLLALPSEALLADRAAQSGLVDVHAIHKARESLMAMLGDALSAQLAKIVDKALQNPMPYQPNAAQAGERMLVHAALAFLMAADGGRLDSAQQMYAQASNLSDRLCAARLIINHGDEAHRAHLIEDFFGNWKHENLVVNQWFILQATRPGADTVDLVNALTEHEAFDWRNPNKVRSLISAFATANPTAFHRLDGSGYRLLGGAVQRLQAANPQIASRMLTPLTRWRRYGHGQDLMRAELQSLADISDLSQDVFEVVQRSLAD